LEPTLFQILTDVLWKPISSLTIVEVLTILALGLIADLGWGFIARLVGALKDRQNERRSLERKTNLRKRENELSNQVGKLMKQIEDADKKYSDAMADAERLQQSERLTLERYEPRFCPFCKSINLHDARYCDRCGRQIPDNLTLACTGCKAVNMAGARHCSVCGGVLPRYCPTCRWVNKDDVTNCERCKSKMPQVRSETFEAIIAAARERLNEEHAWNRNQIEEKLQAKKSGLVRLTEERRRLRVQLDSLISEMDRQERETAPFVSVIVPCHNSESVIEDTLKSLTALQYEQKEIVIVDDASTDRTYELARKYPDRVTLVKRETSTGRKTGAINFGLTFAKGKAIIVVDDDTTPVPRALGEMVVALSDADVAAVAGNVKVKARNYTVLARLQSAEYLVNMELGRPFQNAFMRGLFVISGCFGLFRREILEKIGQYDIDIITEDLDVTWKIYKLQKKVVYRKDAVCYTHVPTSLKAIYRQRLRWDKGLFEVLSKHRNAFLNRRFGRIGLLLLPDTVITEVALLLMRPAWLVSLFLMQYPILPALLLTIYLYVSLEFMSALTAGLLSENKSNVLKALYAPLMFVYRQFLGVVRIAALVKQLSGRKMRW